MKTIIIGDIHGCHEELIQLLQQAGITENDLLIAVGDIVDRGPASVEVYNFLKNRKHTIVLMGNHERKHLKSTLSYAQEIVKLQFGAHYPDFLKWLQTLPYFVETADAIVVHAAYEEGIPLSLQNEAVLSGTTSGERYMHTKYGADTSWQTLYKGEKPIVYGHFVVGELPLIEHNTYGIDTGACHGGYLTGLTLPDFTIHQVKATADYWKTERRKWQLPVLKQKNWETLPIDELKQQVKKFSYQPTDEIKAFLDPYISFLDNLDNYYVSIINALKTLSETLLSTDDFTAHALQFSFSSYLFKCRNNNLTAGDLMKGLNTMEKVTTLLSTLAALNSLPQK